MITGHALESASRRVSRVLFSTIRRAAAIHLRRTSPCACSDLPGSQRGPRFVAMQHTSLFGLAPSGVYPATGVDRRGALLPHLFTLTTTAQIGQCGGIFSVALSVGSRPPGVTWHCVLWSPDFPLRVLRRSGRPADSRPASVGARRHYFKRLLRRFTTDGKAVKAIFFHLADLCCQLDRVTLAKVLGEQR